MEIMTAIIMKMKKIYKKPIFIAEIGCNHMGDISLAKGLIKLACSQGVDYVKFQKRNPKLLLTKEQYDAPHPNEHFSFGKSYGLHREFLEFSFEQHLELYQFCQKNKIKYSTSVWDEDSAIEIIKLNPNFIKVPSACNNNFKLLDILINKYKGDIHISLGMTSRDEENQIIKYFDINNIKRLVLYSCTSGYPVDFNDVCLLEINRLIKTYGDKVKAVGFSGHHLGISIDIAAYVLGAEFIERHFTKNRALKGTDHAASLEPQGVGKLIRDLDATYKSLRYKEKDILDIELPQRSKLKFRKK